MKRREAGASARAGAGAGATGVGRGDCVVQPDICVSTDLGEVDGAMEGAEPPGPGGVQERKSVAGRLCLG